MVVTVAKHTTAVADTIPAGTAKWLPTAPRSARIGCQKGRPDHGQEGEQAEHAALHREVQPEVVDRLLVREQLVGRGTRSDR